MERYLKILRDIKAGKEVSKEDLKYFSKFTFEIDEENIKRLQDTEEFKDMTPEEIDKALRDSFLLTVQKPEYREQILNLAEDTAKSKLSEKITTGLNLALAATDLATSTAQIKSADRAASRLRRPNRPAPLSADPKLEQALSEAKAGNYDSVRALAPAQLAILDNYLSDLNIAKTASTGQAGAYGALGQVASTRRGRRSLELAPLADEIRRSGEKRYDSLLALKLGENQNIHQSRSVYYPTDLQQYSQDAAAVGELGQVGRSNLRSSLTALGSFIPKIVSEMSTRKRFKDIYNQGIAYGEDNARLMADADYNLRQPNYLEQIYS